MSYPPSSHAHHVVESLMGVGDLEEYGAWVCPACYPPEDEQ